jgi:hypothetical protein
MKQFKPSFRLNDTHRTILLLALVLVLILLLSGVSQIVFQRSSDPWRVPVLVTSSPTPSPVPGWWSSMPTALPLFASPTATR